MAKKEEVTKVDRCTSEECKHSEWKFGFCEEHYEQFKFGLITKIGKKVSDHEKKLGHYLAFKKQSAQKAA